MSIYSIERYVELGLSEKEAIDKVFKNKENTSIGIRLFHLKKIFNNLNLDNENISFEKLLCISNEILIENPQLGNVNKFWRTVRIVQNNFKYNLLECVDHIKNVICLYKDKKHPWKNTMFIKDLFSEQSNEYLQKLRNNKAKASCFKEKFISEFETREEGLKQFKIKYASNSIEHIIHKHNVCAEDAKKIVEERSKRGKITYHANHTEYEKKRINQTKRFTLDNYIRKYGNKLGAIKYQELLKARKGVGTLEWYISKYGEEEGKIMFQKKRGKHNSYYCKEYWISRGLNEKEAVDKITELFSTRPNFSKKYCIEKYGEEEGLVLWRRRNDLWQETLKNKPQEEINRINKTKAITIDNFISKYGEEEGKRRFINRNRGGGLVSTESKKFFIKLYKKLRKLAIIARKDVYFGVSGSKEYFIRNKSAIRFYDFTIPSLKIIIEYNGITYHPKEGQIDWKSPFGVGYEDKLKYDREKKKMAEEEGFFVYTIWSDSNLIEELYNIIMIIIDIKEGECLEKDANNLW